jgi:hypothetical protein
LPAVNNCRILVVIGRAAPDLDNDHFLIEQLICPIVARPVGSRRYENPTRRDLW